MQNSLLMKLLITGGTGFLGRHLVWLAASMGAEVIFTGRKAQAAKEVISLAKGKVNWQPLEHGSDTAANTLMELARGVDAIVHCAGLSSPWGQKAAFHQANVISTQEVLAAGHANKVQRLVHISTPSLYFDFSDRLNIREDYALPRAVNHYAQTKKTAETLIRDNPLPQTVIMRPRALFGPWDQTLLPRLLRVMAQGPIPLMRGGKAMVDLTYIDNATHAIWLALTRWLPHALATYNIANGEPRAIQDILSLVAREFGIPLRTRRIPWPVISLLARLLELQARLSSGDEPLLTRYSVGVLAFSQTLNIDAITQDLGYFPKVSVEAGIARHAEWWRSQQLGKTAP